MKFLSIYHIFPICSSSYSRSSTPSTESKLLSEIEEEEYDNLDRMAYFALRTTDLKFWKASINQSRAKFRVVATASVAVAIGPLAFNVKAEASPESCHPIIALPYHGNNRAIDTAPVPLNGDADAIETNRDPITVQHWAVVVFLPGKPDKYFIFEADEEEGLLQPSRGTFTDANIYKLAKEFGSLKTNPRELLECARKVARNGKEYVAYNPFGRTNHCQDWVKDFLLCISPQLLDEMHRTIPTTILSEV